MSATSDSAHPLAVRAGCVRLPSGANETANVQNLLQFRSPTFRAGSTERCDLPTLGKLNPSPDHPFDKHSNHVCEDDETRVGNFILPYLVEGSIDTEGFGMKTLGHIT